MARNEDRFDWRMTVEVTGSHPYASRQVELEGTVWVAPEDTPTAYGIEAIRAAVSAAAKQVST